MNNAAQKVTRIDKDAWEIATELANEYGVSICHIISESVRYCAENAEFKEMDVVVKRLVVGSKVLEQEGGDVFDLLSVKVVMDEEILASIDNSFGPMVEGYTKDQKIKFILNFDRALRIAKILNENPDILEKQSKIHAMILKKAQE